MGSSIYLIFLLALAQPCSSKRQSASQTQLAVESSSNMVKVHSSKFPEKLCWKTLVSNQEGISPIAFKCDEDDGTVVMNTINDWDGGVKSSAGSLSKGIEVAVGQGTAPITFTVNGKEAVMDFLDHQEVFNVQDSAFPKELCGKTLVHDLFPQPMAFNCDGVDEVIMHDLDGDGGEMTLKGSISLGLWVPNPHYNADHLRPEGEVLPMVLTVDKRHGTAKREVNGVSQIFNIKDSAFPKELCWKSLVLDLIVDDGKFQPTTFWCDGDKVTMIHNNADHDEIEITKGSLSMGLMTKASSGDRKVPWTFTMKKGGVFGKTEVTSEIEGTTLGYRLQE